MNQLPFKRIAFQLLCCAFTLGATAFNVEGQSPPVTAAAQREGWWIRLNPSNQATHVYWRFGDTAKTLGAPVTWAAGESPQAIDVPVAQRTLARLHIAALGLRPAAPVSFCVFFQEHGVALIEFTQETTAELDQAQNAPECVP
jgi:hypothetical protein